MSERQNAVGILFDVSGGGDINGESGKRIRDSISQIVNKLGDDPSTKIKFSIDVDELKKQMSNMTKDVAKTIGDLKKDIDQIISSTSGGKGGSKKGGNGSGTNTSAYKDAIKTLKEYYKQIEKVERAQTRTTDIIGSDGVFKSQTEQWQPLIDQMDEARQKYNSVISASKNFTAEQRSAFEMVEESLKLQRKVSQSSVTSSAQESWRKLTSNVNQYIDRVEYSASRNKEAADALEELRNLANNGSYQNYDELKRKLAEVEHQINKNSLATETWGQKMLKTFGSRIRSALAGVATAKIGQYITEVYKNVVALDEAVVNLQIATGKNREEVKKLVKEYSNLAQQLGATTSEVAAGADTWLRQGLSESDTEDMIKNTMMLSKLGQMESAEAAEALTSAMKGYNVAVSDAISIVDKWTAVDMKAAANAGDMATAMSETATSAGLAGVEMDKLIGYITVVKEVTQDGAESVGTFYKTLFARMNNVAAGNFIDSETGEALNDVEKVLGELGIALRDTSGVFRESGDVLDEVASKWNTYDNVQRHAIATAFAGTRQQEKFIVLMENYGAAIDYANIASESSGTATEKFGAYLDGVQGSIDSLTASFESFSITILNSDILSMIFDLFTSIMNAVTSAASVIDKIGGLPTVLLAVASALLVLNGGLVAYNAQMKITTAYSAILSFFTKLKSGLMSVLTAIPNAIVAWKSYASGVISASSAMQASIPIIGLVLAAITALVGAITLFNNSSKETDEDIRAAASSAAELSEEISNLTYEYLTLSDAVDADNGAKQKLLDTQDKILKNLKLERYEIDELIDKYGSYTEAIKHASLEKLKEAERDMRGGLSVERNALLAAAAKNKLVDPFMQISSGNHYKNNKPTKDNYDSYAALKALEDAGFISSRSYSVYTDAEQKRWSAGFSMPYQNMFDLNSVEGVIDAYEYLGEMLDIIGDAAGENNFVYETIYKEYTSVADAVQKYESSISALNQNLAQQYALESMIGQDMPKTRSEFEKYRECVIDAAVTSGEFAGTTTDVENAIDSVLSKQSEFADFYNSQSGVPEVVPLQSVSSIIDGIKDRVDIVSTALKEMSDSRRLSAETVAEIFNPENGFEDIQKYVEMTADGWVMDVDALERLRAEKRAEFASIIEEIQKGDELENQESLDNAIANLKQFDAAWKTLTYSVRTPDPHPFVEMLEEIEGPYETLKGAIDEMAKDGALNADTVAKILGDFPELGEYVVRETDGTWTVVEGAMDKFIAKLRAKIWATGDKEQLTWFDSVIQTLGVKDRDVESEINTYLGVFKDVEGALNTLQSAMSEFKETGFVSNDTVANILDPENGFPELHKYLIETAEGYKLDVDAIEKFLIAKRQEYDAIVLSYEIGSEERKQAMQMRNWLEIAIKSIQRESEEYKNLADVLDYVAEKYDTASKASEDMQKYGKLTDSSLAGILGDEDLSKFLTRQDDGSHTFDIDAFDKWVESEIVRLTALRDSYELSRYITDDYQKADTVLQNFLASVSAVRAGITGEEDTEHIFVQRLKEIEGPYTALKSALDEMAADGYLSLDTVSKIYADFPELAKYIELGTDNLYRVIEGEADALQQYITDLRNKFAGTESESIVESIIKLLGLETADDPEEVIDTFSEMLEYIRGPYEALKTAMDEMAEKGILTSDTVDKLLGDFPELKAYVERGTDGLYRIVEGEVDALKRWISEKSKEFSDPTVKGLFESVIAMLGLENADEPEDVIDTFSEMLDHIRGPYDALKTAVDEMAEDGALTPDTVYKLLGDFPELEAYVERGADGLYRLVQGEIDALQQWIKNKREEFTSDEQRSLFDDIIHLLGLEGEDKQEPEFVNPLSVILNEVESSYDLLRSAKKDMEEYGVISESTLSSLANLAEEDYEALKGYFTLTADGYTMCSGALEQYVDAKKSEYAAILASHEVGSDAYNAAYQDLENLLAVFMTLSLSDQIEEATEALEEQTEALEGQIEVLEAEQDAWEERRDTYQEIIDYRKELLQTFKEELDYQKELERRQRNIADLQTRLSVARLDRSASGRAKIRELEEELESAQEDMEDFTLEHAIEQITAQMDRESEEYNRFIDSKVAEIDAAIKDVETEIENVQTAIENVSRSITSGTSTISAQINALLSEYGIVSPTPVSGVYHSGGFVGGDAVLKSNEEFAKLMVGEHVSTPAQIQRFMNETLPSIATVGSRNEFNAPLISIECGSVTPESLPGLKQIVNEAVREVKKQLDDGFSRTGYKKPRTSPA